MIAVTFETEHMKIGNFRGVIISKSAEDILDGKRHEQQPLIPIK